ncbi:MAG: hypothetical protein HXY34_03950 [Candidatus Thorarchaeota archaeon]|nr:hypothetical protein [Candidatus Thorarchaeota archaeon]
MVQDDEGKTYDVSLSSAVMEAQRFLPRVGMRVIVHGFVEEAEYGLSDFVVTRVSHVRHEGADVKRVVKFED